MSRVLLPILVFCGALVGALLGAQLAGGPDEGVTEAARPVDPGIAQALEDIRRRLDRPPELTPPGGSGGESANPGSFEARLKGIEDKLDALVISAPGGAEGGVVNLKEQSDGAVTARARTLFTRREYDLALKYWEEVLRRNPDADVRYEALYGAGIGYRTVKNHEKEEETFLELANLRGEDTEEGLGALFQVAWSRYYQEDYRGGRDLMARIAKAPNSSVYTRPYARLYAASFAMKAGETEGVRGVLDELRRDYGKDMSQTGRSVMSQVERLARQLEGE